MNATIEIKELEGYNYISFIDQEDANEYGCEPSDPIEFDQQLAQLEGKHFLVGCIRIDAYQLRIRGTPYEPDQKIAHLNAFLNKCQDAILNRSMAQVADSTIKTPQIQS